MQACALGLGLVTWMDGEVCRHVHDVTMTWLRAKSRVRVGARQHRRRNTPCPRFCRIDRAGPRNSTCVFGYVSEAGCTNQLVMSCFSQDRPVEDVKPCE